MKLINKHSRFLRGVVVGMFIGLSGDIFVLHWVFQHHRLYSGETINVTESVIFVVLIVVVLYLIKKEGESLS